MQKNANPIGQPDFPKKNKGRCNFILFQNGGYRRTKSLPCKVREKSGKIRLDTKNRQSVPSSSAVFVGEDCSTALVTFFLLLTNTFRLFRCIESFLYCSISESGCLIFHLLLFFLYLDSVCQLLGSYGLHVLVVDPVKWAIWRPQPQSFRLET